MLSPDINETLIDYRVKIIKKVIRFSRIFLFAFMFAVCLVMGIAPIIPKRKEQLEVEVKMEETEKKNETKENIMFFKADS